MLSTTSKTWKRSRPTQKFVGLHRLKFYLWSRVILLHSAIIGGSQMGERSLLIKLANIQDFPWKKKEKENHVADMLCEGPIVSTLSRAIFSIINRWHLPTLAITKLIMIYSYFYYKCCSYLEMLKRSIENKDYHCRTLPTRRRLTWLGDKDSSEGISPNRTLQAIS